VSRRALSSTDRAGRSVADPVVPASPASQPQGAPRGLVSGPSVLEVSGLRVAFGGAPAVDGVSLSVQRGEVVGLIGPNGAGKSSMLNAISGDLHPTAGSIRLSGRDVTRLPAHRRARLGMARTSQTARVFEGLTVFEGLVTFARGAEGASLARTLLHRGQRLEEAEAAELAWGLLDRHGFAHIADLYGRELSGGQRRFVDLAMALIRSPQLLLLDEPMVGVASAILPGLMSALRDAAGRSVGVLMVEHALDLVAELCDRVIVMASGNIIASGTYEEIAADVEVRRAYLS
jgi:branched-chain amino acid transport system ATP-binding protein